MANDVERIANSSAKAAARLCNFPTGFATLLPGHTTYLDNEVAPVIRTMQGPWVDLWGYASRLGDTAKNKTLSQQRINEVKQHVSAYAPQINFQINEPLGESESGPDESNDDGYYRAVSVYVFAFKPPVRQPEPPPPQPPSTRRLVFREFSKIDAANNISGPGEDNAKEFTQAMIDIIGSKLAPEASLEVYERRAGRRVRDVPNTHRVNKVTIETTISYDVVASGGSVTITTTTVSYEWGPAMPNVAIEERYAPVIFNEKKPVQTKTKSLPRAKAESTPWVVPINP